MIAKQTKKFDADLDSGAANHTVLEESSTPDGDSSSDRAERENNNGDGTRNTNSLAPGKRRFWGSPEDPIAEDVERVVRGLASIGVLAAAVISTLEYRSSNKATQSERSLALVESWQANNYDEDFASLQLFIEGKLDSLGDAEAQIGILEGAALDAALGNLGRIWLIENREGPNPEALEARIDRVMLFFEQMDTCIDADLCADTVLERYFNDQVQSFWNYFKHYTVLRKAEGYIGYGDGVENLSNTFLDLYS